MRNRATPNATTVRMSAWRFFRPAVAALALTTLVGALTGTSTAFAFTSWTSVEWPLVVGGKPIISIPAFIPIVFEMSVLFGALATVIGLFVLSKLPNVKPAVVYDPEFTAGRYGVYVEASGDRLAEAKRIMNEQEPIELREGEGGASA